MSTLAAPRTRKLPIWRTVGACYSTVARNLGQLVRMSWLWLLIMLPVYAGLHWLGWAWQQEDTSVGATVAFASIVELPFLASIAVAWHRLVLREERVTAPAYLRLDGIVWLYVLYSLLLTLPVMLLALILEWVAYPAFLAVEQSSIAAILTADPEVDFDPFLSYLALLFLFLLLVALVVAVPILLLLRLLLVLPAVALGERLSLWEARRITRGNTLRLALATLLCILPAVVPMLPLLWWDWSAATVSRAAYVGGELINSLGIAVLTIFSVTLLSLTYRFFAASPDESTPPSA